MATAFRTQNANRRDVHVAVLAVRQAVGRGENLVEGVGFEPTVEFPPRRFSRPVP